MLTMAGSKRQVAKRIAGRVAIELGKYLLTRAALPNPHKLRKNVIAKAAQAAGNSIIRNSPLVSPKSLSSRKTRTKTDRNRAKFGRAARAAVKAGFSPGTTAFGAFVRDYMETKRR